MKNDMLILIALFLLLNTPLCAGTHYDKVNSDVRTGMNACLSFENDYGCFPPHSNWLEELMGGENAVINTHKCVFLNVMLPFNDPWGNPYIYKFPGIHNPHSFDFYSMGRDGKTKSGGNDRDDINSWDTDNRTYRHYHPLITPSKFIYMMACLVLTAAIVITGIRKKSNIKSQTP